MRGPAHTDRRGPRSVFAVDVAAMTQTEDKNDKLCVVDLVDDAVVASTHSPFARAADHRRPTVLCSHDPMTCLIRV